MDPFNSRYILNEKRWLWIDYDKGISIILVGYGHCMATLSDHGLPLSSYPFFNYIGVFLYGFRMPLFFIVSGLLVGRSLNKKGLGNYIGDRTNNILYPLFIWGAIQITLQLFMSRFTHNTVSPISYLDLIIDPRQTGHFWYLNALFCIGVIYAVLKSKLKIKPVPHLIFGLVLFSISAYIHVYDRWAGFLTDICEYYIFFALGDVLSNVMLNDENRAKFASWKIFIPLLVSFIVIQYFFTQINLRPSSESINYVEHKMPFFFLVEALVGCAISINISFLLQRSKALTFLRIIGFHSLFVYCMQIIVMTFARTIFMNVMHITYVPALIILVWWSGVILPVFFYNFCLKYGLWWLYTYRKPERQVAYMKTANIFWFDRNKKTVLKQEEEALMNTN
ncbi:MAG TPA: acyltransferase [Mucilaginibacter sp.]|nr:acyltransferase [Mucilaginibacter sp.]